MAEQVVLQLRRREIVTPRVAVTLREKNHAVAHVDEAVAVDVGDVVIHRVGRFALGVREIPEQAVEHRRAVVRVLAAQQCQLLVNQRRDLVLECKHSGRHRTVAGTRAGQIVAAAAAETNRRIQRVGVSLVAEQQIKIADARGGELQRVGNRRAGDGRGKIDAQVFAAIQDRGVERDEADVLDDVLVRVQRHGAGIRRAELLNDGGVSRRGARREIADARLVRIHGAQDALDPAFGELRFVIGLAVAINIFGR